MSDLTVCDLRDLRALGIKYCPTHLKRLMFKYKTFPVWFPLNPEKPKSRKVWWRREIEAWLRSRGGK